jgi:hypothetical protein
LHARAIAVALAIGSIALAGCADDDEADLKVGACTNADPTEALSLDVKAVECGSDDAKSRIVREVEKSSECDVASVSDSSNDKVYCTEPYPPGSVPTKPAVGVCTTADPDQAISVNIRLVNCDDKQAKSKITKRAKTEAGCSKGSVRGSEGQIFCIEPVR